MTTHQHQPLTDDATIDGTDLLAEIRAQLGYGPAPAPAAAPSDTDPPSEPTPTDEEFTIDGFELLRRLRAEANVDPLVMDHKPSGHRPADRPADLAAGPTLQPSAERWVPPGPAVRATRVAAKPGRWQLAAVIGAFALGVVVTAVAIGLLGWGLGA